jgi:hypothetical protein
MTVIHISIDDEQAGTAPLVTVQRGAEHLHPAARACDAALVARVMLQSAAYLFAQGQPVRFGKEVPLECLK